MLNLTEQYLVESIKKGELKAFEFLFRNYYSDLWKYARNIVQNDSIAEDLVMDVFVKLWECASKLAIKSSLSGYLYQSVHNHCLNYLTRKHKRFTELNTDTIDRLNALVPLSDVYDPLDSINNSELRDRIEQSVESLPGECRKIFLLSRFDGLPNKEIATKLGLSENTVKVQIYRALKKLRVLLRDFLTTSVLF